MRYFYTYFSKVLPLCLSSFPEKMRFHATKRDAVLCDVSFCLATLASFRLRRVSQGLLLALDAL